MKMMYYAPLLLILLASCHNKKSSVKAGSKTAYEAFIPVDSAKKMVSSYLTSINYQANDTELRSITISAAELRYYLDSLPNSSNIKNVEIKFAHKLSYINSGNKDKPAGLKTRALTVILVGLDQTGEYIYANDNVINRGTPCPFNCANANPMF